MLHAPFKVVLDANVLYPFTLRDTLLRAAGADLFQVYWSQQILHEATRNLVVNDVMTEDKAQRLAAAMTSAFPEAEVTDYESLIASMKNDEKDRHVAAAAVKVGAQVIVTENVRDFRDLPNGLEAQTADDFLCNLFELNPELVVSLLGEQAGALRAPPSTFEQLIERLRHIAPNFAKAVQQHVGP